MGALIPAGGAEEGDSLAGTWRVVLWCEAGSAVNLLRWLRLKKKTTQNSLIWGRRKGKQEYFSLVEEGEVKNQVQGRLMVPAST